jgi:hypothetical protein
MLVLVCCEAFSWVESLFMLSRAASPLFVAWAETFGSRMAPADIDQEPIALVESSTM